MNKMKLAVLAAAAVMTAGMTAVTSWAAEGWSKQKNTWVYYDSQGYLIRDEWKKGADKQWGYRTGDGVMGGEGRGGRARREADGGEAVAGETGGGGWTIESCKDGVDKNVRITA